MRHKLKSAGGGSAKNSLKWGIGGKLISVVIIVTFTLQGQFAYSDRGQFAIGNRLPCRQAGKRYKDCLRPRAARERVVLNRVFLGAEEILTAIMKEVMALDTMRARIEKLCEFRGISLKKLAAKAGIGRPHVWRIVRGKQQIKSRAETIKKLAAALGVNEEVLTIRQPRTITDEIIGKVIALDTMGERVKFLRTYKGWSRAELERRSGVSKPAILRIETGRNRGKPQRATVLKFAGAFGVGADLLNPNITERLSAETLRDVAMLDSVGERIKFLCKIRGMSLKDLGVRAGVSKSHIWIIIQDGVKTKSRPDTLKKLADALGVGEEVLTGPQAEPVPDAILGEALALETTAKKLRYLRNYERLSGRELASRAKVAVSQIVNIEVGKITRPTKSTLLKLEAALRVPAGTLSPQRADAIPVDILRRALSMRTNGERLRYMRGWKGWSMRELSELSGVSLSAIKGIEYNRSTSASTPETLTKLAKTLGTSAFIFGINVPNGKGYGNSAGKTDLLDRADGCLKEAQEYLSAKKYELAKYEFETAVFYASQITNSERGARWREIIATAKNGAQTCEINIKNMITAIIDRNTAKKVLMKLLREKLEIIAIEIRKRNGKVTSDDLEKARNGLMQYMDGLLSMMVGPLVLYADDAGSIRQELNKVIISSIMKLEAKSVAADKTPPSANVEAVMEIAAEIINCHLNSFKPAQVDAAHELLTDLTEREAGIADEEIASALNDCFVRGNYGLALSIVKEFRDRLAAANHKNGKKCGRVIKAQI